MRMLCVVKICKEGSGVIIKRLVKHMQKKHGKCGKKRRAVRNERITHVSDIWKISRVATRDPKSNQHLQDVVVSSW